MENLAETLRSLESKKPTLIKQALSEIPDWDSFLKHKRESQFGAMLRAVSPTLTLIYSSSPDVDFHRLKGVRAFYDVMAEAFGESFEGDSWTFISESLEGQTGWLRHYDLAQLFHWCCVGTSSWTLWDKDENETHFIVEAGDILSIPSGMDHEVESLTEHRAGIAYATYGYVNNRTK